MVAILAGSAPNSCSCHFLLHSSILCCYSHFHFNLASFCSFLKLFFFFTDSCYFVKAVAVMQLTVFLLSGCSIGSPRMCSQKEYFNMRGSFKFRNSTQQSALITRCRCMTIGHFHNLKKLSEMCGGFRLASERHILCFELSIYSRTILRSPSSLIYSGLTVLS